MSIKYEIVNTVGRATYKPNVLYVGNEQYNELVDYTKAIAVITHFMGMKVLRVREESWLQVGVV